MGKVRRFCEWLLRQRYPAVLVALGLLLTLPSLWAGLQLDDFTIRAAVSRSEIAEGIAGNPWEPFMFLDGDPEHTRKLMDRGLAVWWTDPRCRASFVRPVTALTHIVDFRLFADYPVLMHLQSLVWYALLVWAAAVLYRRMISPTLPAWTAALAALLFTVDDAHATPVGWVANRNVLPATLFGILTLIAHDRWRRQGHHGWAWLAPLALLAGLLSKETAVCTGAYLLAYALFVDGGRWTSRLRSLLPYAAVGLVWYAWYKSLGCGTARLDQYTDPANNPAGFARHVVGYGPILLLGQWGLPVSDLAIGWSASALRVHWIGAAVFCALLALVLFPLLRKDALARFWALGMVLSLLPACIAFPSDRLLMFVGIGGMGLLAQFLGGMEEGASWWPRLAPWRWSLRAFGWVMVGIHLVVAPPLLLVGSYARLPGRAFHGLLATFPDDPRLQSQTAVFVNSVSWASKRLLVQMRHYEGRPIPAHILDLNAAWSRARLTRVDDYTLTVRPEGGYLQPRDWWPEGEQPPVFSLIYPIRLLDRSRSEKHPLQLGETVELTAATIQITELTDDGRPAEATFRFGVPLEDPSLRWFQVTKQGYVPWKPPAIGETVDVPLPRGDPAGPSTP